MTWSIPYVKAKIQAKIKGEEAILARLSELENAGFADAEIINWDPAEPSIHLDNLTMYCVYNEIKPVAVFLGDRYRYPWQISIPKTETAAEMFELMDDDKFHHYFHSMGLEGEVKNE